MMAFYVNDLCFSNKLRKSTFSNSNRSTNLIDQLKSNKTQRSKVLYNVIDADLECPKKQFVLVVNNCLSLILNDTRQFHILKSCNKARLVFNTGWNSLSPKKECFYFRAKQYINLKWAGATPSIIFSFLCIK